MAFANLSFETAGTGGVPASWTKTSQSQRDYAPYGAASDQPWETFEREWNSNESYVFSFDDPATLTPAQYQTIHITPKFFDDFEEFWSSNQNYRFGKLDDGVAASYNTSSPHNFESFEQEWESNESYIYEFTGLGADLTVAIFAGDGFFTFESEGFESGWQHNGDEYLTAFVGIGTDLTAALYDTGTPQAFEDFEEEWTGHEMTTM